MKINQILEKASFYYIVALICAFIAIWLGINIFKTLVLYSKIGFIVSVTSFGIMILLFYIGANSKKYGIYHKDLARITTGFFIFLLVWFVTSIGVFLFVPGNLFLFYFCLIFGLFLFIIGKIR